MPVLIVGGGLAGLSAAVLLAWRGVPCHLVERRASTACHPRARGVNFRSLELLRDVPGLEADLAGAGRIGTDDFTLVIAESVTGREFGRMVTPGYVDRQSFTPASICTAGQDRIELILLRHAYALGATIRFSTELGRFTQDARGVRALLRDAATGEQTEVTADYLIAADGSRSPVRHALGIGVHGHGIMSDNLSILFEADLGAILQGRGLLLYFVQNPGFTGTFVSTDDPNVGQLSVEYDPALECAADYPPARVVEMVRAALGLPGLNVAVRDVMQWQSSSQIADRMAEGRVFLAGDAAHTMPPTGGLGGQTAIQDAADLAWKLSLVLQGQAGPALLDTYAAERHPIAQLTVARQTTSYLERFRRRERAVVSTASTETDYLRVAMGYRYRSDAILDDAPDDEQPTEDPRDPSGRPGTRLAHIAVIHEGRTISTLDLVARGLTLLTGPEGAGWTDAARTVALQLGLDLVAFQLDVDLSCDVRGFMARTGLATDGALLVRPDAFIAWRGRRAESDAATVLKGVLARVLCRDIAPEPLAA